MPSGFDRSRDDRQTAMSNATLGYYILGKRFDLLSRSPQHRDFHAAIVVERHADRRNREIMVILKGVCQSFWQNTGLSVKHIRKARHAFARAVCNRLGCHQTCSLCRRW